MKTQERMKFKAVYVIPWFSPVVIEKPEDIGTARYWIRTVLEDDLDAAAERGEDWKAIPPIRLSAPFNALKKGGTEMPRPTKSMSDENAAAWLWTLIGAMALSGIYIANTDHLTDRQLYEALRDDLLRWPALLVPAALGYGYCIVLTETGEAVTRRDDRLPKPVVNDRKRVLPASN